MNDVLNKDQWITFYLDGEAYAQPIVVIREIVPYREPAPVPGSPHEVEGIVNIRGDVISVINTRRLMNLSDYEPDEHSRILIIESGDNLLGFTVDNVSEIVGFNREEIENSHAEHALVKGTVQLEQGLYIVTDLGEFSHEQDDYE